MMMIAKERSMVRCAGAYKREATCFYTSGGAGALETAKGIGASPKILSSWIKECNYSTVILIPLRGKEPGSLGKIRETNCMREQGLSC